MKNKCSIIILFTAILSSSLWGQQSKPVIAFAEKEFNFGTFAEASGAVTHDFKFSNQGKAPLILSEVNASCGCTVTEWPREPILPGKSGVIKVTFDPLRQSGTFTKSIQISSNADVPSVTLVIRGVVIPSEKVEDVYKFTIGSLRFETIYAAFGEIFKGKTALFSIKVFNTSSDKPARITFQQLPAHISIKVIPEVVEPQQAGVIAIQYNTGAISDWDYVVDRITLLINGSAVPNNRLNITANIKENFSDLTAADLAQAPRTEVDNMTFDFGTITDQKVVEHEFKLTNTGQSDLLIRKVSASCGCTAVQPAKVKIPPGETTVIKAVFNPAGREGDQKKAITVITNDPRRSRIILWVNGKISKTHGNTIQ
jgi:hypothetical protein